VINLVRRRRGERVFAPSDQLLGLVQTKQLNGVTTAVDASPINDGVLKPGQCVPICKVPDRLDSGTWAEFDATQ
jgi:hypothetical protein